MKALYSLADVGRQMGVSRQTVSDWVKRGELTAVRLGGRPYVPLAALQVHGLIWASIVLADQVNARG